MWFSLISWPPKTGETSNGLENTLYLQTTNYMNIVFLGSMKKEDTKPADMKTFDILHVYLWIKNTIELWTTIIQLSFNFSLCDQTIFFLFLVVL